MKRWQNHLRLQLHKCFHRYLFSVYLLKKQSTHYSTHEGPEGVSTQGLVPWVASPGQEKLRFSRPPNRGSFPTTMLSISQGPVKVPAAETGGRYSFSIWWDFRKRNWTEGTPIIKFSHTHTLIFWSLFSISAQIPLSFLSFSRDTFGDETIHSCPFTDNLWQHNWQWVCCKKKRKRKCCFNNLGLKYILLYASKGFNKKSTCRDIFSWLKQQSKAYKCSPTIMTYL